MSNQMHMKRFSGRSTTPEVGDVFYFQIDRAYYFGRVVMFVPKVLPANFMGPLIYVYKYTASTPSPPSVLATGDLLCPPFATNLLPWRRGYFVFLENRPVVAQDLLRVHCFADPADRPLF